MILEVRKKPDFKPHTGLLTYAGKTISCSLGRSGTTVFKREGDGATPIGDFSILYGFFRPDRFVRVDTGLTMIPIANNSGWCDQADDPNYNSFVTLPFGKSHEVMTREDGLYDICLVLDYNISQKSRNRGSAIFFHLTRPDRGPTEGCVAIDPQEMSKLLPLLSEKSKVRIHG